MLIMTRDLKVLEIGPAIELIGNYLLKRKTNRLLYLIIYIIKFMKKFLLQNI